MHNGQTIISEYLSGRRAAKAGQCIPDGASRHFLDGYRLEQHEMAIARAGWAYKNGRISAAVLADVVKEVRSYP